MSKSVKAKAGIFFGYNGEGFLGMQYQRDTDNTVENVLHRVLCEQGFVLKTNMDSLKRIKWSRAGRTDKKVHALCNGISCSLELDQRYQLDQSGRSFDWHKVARDINADLPPDIRIFAIKKVGKGFDMRHDASSRVYNYLVPLRLCLPKPLFADDSHSLDELARDELVTRLNQLAALYVGTHSFHNFTKGYRPNDPRCDRYLTAVTAELVEPEQVEAVLGKLPPTGEGSRKSQTFIRFTLTGQSFIYHQIRKMIGLLIKICYEELEGEEAIRQAFGKEKYDIYLAPAEGLYLNRMTFEGYNRRREKEPHLQVELNEEDEQRIRDYRSYLEARILEHQLRDQVFTQWLEKHEEKYEESEGLPSDRGEE